MFTFLSHLSPKRWLLNSVENDKQAWRLAEQSARARLVEGAVLSADWARVARGLDSPSPKLLEKWYRVAAEANDAEAQTCYAEAVQKRDSALAFNWYRRAALNLHIKSLFRVGLCYANRDGVECNQQVARDIYNFLKPFTGGELSEVDLELAFFWLNVQAEPRKVLLCSDPILPFYPLNLKALSWRFFLPFRRRTVPRCLNY
jgi:TPR repeat protein